MQNNIVFEPLKFRHHTVDGAAFSDCGEYRFALWRMWNPHKGFVMFIGLNPSTATAKKNDRTISRVMTFAYQWGYGGVAMLNLYPFITPYPSLILRNENLALNDSWLAAVGCKAAKIVFAWGGFKVQGRDERIKGMFPTRFALAINVDGSPRHPLYVPGETELIIY